jgi:hypothetical protein
LPIAALSLLALASAHLFDYGTFLVMTARHGLVAELNPVVVAVAQDYGLPGLTLAKVLSVLFLSLTAVLMVRVHRRKVAGALIVIGITAGLIGGFSNIASM